MLLFVDFIKTLYCLSWIVLWIYRTTIGKPLRASSVCGLTRPPLVKGLNRRLRPQMMPTYPFFRNVLTPSRSNEPHSAYSLHKKGKQKKSGLLIQRPSIFNRNITHQWWLKQLMRMRRKQTISIYCVHDKYVQQPI